MRGDVLEEHLPATHELDELVAVEGSAEEELQQPLVAYTEFVVVAGEPLLYRALACRCDPVDAPADAAPRLLRRDSEPGLFEAAQLRIDLAVAGAPEEAGRAICRLL